VFEKILVPLDGSNNAEIVLPYLELIADRFRAEITLATVAEPGAADKSHFYLAYLERIAEQLQDTLKHRGVAKTKVSVKVLTGRPADEIIKYSAQIKSNLIVMAGHGASGGTPVLLGSIATKILSGANTPVLLIRAAAGKITGRTALLKRIMVPLDGSKMGENSLKIVEPLASQLGAEIVLFQAVEPVRYIPGFETMVPNVVLPSDDEVKHAAVEYLRSVEQAFRQKGIKTSVAVVADAPAEAIIDYAEANDISIIAMTTHGLSGIKRWVFGSTTEKVLQAGSKPLLIIPPAKT